MQQKDVSLLESLMNSPFIAVIAAEHKPAFPFMKIFPGRRLQRTSAQMQLKRQASQISIKYYYILWLIKTFISSWLQNIMFITKILSSINILLKTLLHVHSIAKINMK